MTADDRAASRDTSPSSDNGPSGTDDATAGDAGDSAGEAAGGSGLAAERQRRQQRVDDLRADGAEPYPYRYDRTHSAAEVRALGAELEAGTETDIAVDIAARVMLKRDAGKLVFATVADRGETVQLFVSKAVVGDAGFELAKHLDRGDWIGAAGTVMTTRAGEISIKVERLTLLAKSIRPLPDKWHGLSDVDTRFRQRYVDLIVNADARRTFAVRHAVVASIRQTLVERGFIEVETPVLHAEVGGATARPFITHHNTLDMPLYLRIATELHLKRLIVGGLDRVFEIGRTFRNEGMDTTHNPEFTMMESYQAFGDVADAIELTEALVTAAALAATGSATITIGETTVDLTEPWPRRRMVDLVSEAVGRDVGPATPIAELRALADRHDVRYESTWGGGKLVEELFGALCEDAIVRPTFVTGHPVEVSPLARLDPDDPELTDRFELFIAGKEYANGYSELNDPVDQRRRFEAEEAAKAAGDLERGTVDEDYLRALEYGLPPTAGLGVGIDRLVMLLAGVDSIREVILFPTLRPEVFKRSGDLEPGVPVTAEPDAPTASADQPEEASR